MNRLIQFTDLGQYKSLYNDLEKLAGFGYWLADTAGENVFLSENLYAIFGLIPDPNAGSLEPLLNYVHPDDRQGLLAAFHKLTTDHLFTEDEFRITRPDGHLRYLKQSGKLVHNGGSRPAILATIQDITEIRLLGLEQKILRGEPAHADGRTSDYDLLIRQVASKAELAELLNDSSIDRVMALDLGMNIIAWNKRSELITGTRKEDIIGKSFLEVFPELRSHELTLKAIDQALLGRNSFIPSNKGPEEGGHYENHYISLKDEHGRVTGVLNIKHDVAHRIKVEKELKSLNKALARKNKELKQKNSELTSFSYITSHDLKEPLRKIYTFIELIFLKESNNLSESGKTYFRRIQASVQRMGLLTDDILAFSQLEVDEKAMTTVDLGAVLKMVKRSLREQLDSHHATIICDQLPPVKGYQGLLVQLFRNLLGNALKFQSEGNAPVIEIGCSLIKGADMDHPDAQAEAGYYRITFKDNGIGFDQGYSERVFQMFQRLHSIDRYPGTGIGLAICRKIAQLHGGFMNAESEPGKGSIFYLHLPSPSGA